MVACVRGMALPTLRMHPFEHPAGLYGRLPELCRPSRSSDTELCSQLGSASVPFLLAFFVKTQKALVFLAWDARMQILCA